MTKSLECMIEVVNTTARNDQWQMIRTGSICSKVRNYRCGPLERIDLFPKLSYQYSSRLLGINSLLSGIPNIKMKATLYRQICK
jgi:hypothetical protein